MSTVLSKHLLVTSRLYGRKVSKHTTETTRVILSEKEGEKHSIPYQEVRLNAPRKTPLEASEAGSIFPRAVSTHEPSGETLMTGAHQAPRLVRLSSSLFSTPKGTAQRYREVDH